MRFMIFSDAHGSTGNLRVALERNLRSGCKPDGVFFCGDGFVSAFETVSSYNIKFIGVKGNCDPDFSPYGKPKSELLVEFFGKKILLTHGDRFGVSAGTDRLESYARQRGADILLFGHTHVKFEHYADGLYTFNPGSISAPRDSRPSFGILELNENIVLLSHGLI